MQEEESSFLERRRRRLLLRLSGALGLAGVVLLGNSNAWAKSSKRGVAYDVASLADLAALSRGVTWWYDWGAAPNAALPADYHARFHVDYLPMLWNFDFDAARVEAFLAGNPTIRYLMVLNEPNLVGQSDVTPQQAAALWPRYEVVAAAAHVQIVGPQITWGTMPGYEDPVVWLDAFYAAYEAAHGGRKPRVDYLGFHWYDYGLDTQLARLDRYGKRIWVSEFANWHSQADGAQIDSLAKQEAQMTELVAICEARGDVFRYAWFTGRVSPDPHFTSLFEAGSGVLSPLGALYVSLPGK